MTTLDTFRFPLGVSFHTLDPAAAARDCKTPCGVASPISGAVGTYFQKKRGPCA